jgi:hypothetical protein
VFLADGHCPSAQFPPTLCNTWNADGNTGNLIGNNTEFAWADNLYGGTGQATNTYKEVFAEYGNVNIDQIVLVTDSSGGTKTVTLMPCVTVDQRSRSTALRPRVRLRKDATGRGPGRFPGLARVCCNSEVAGRIGHATGCSWSSGGPGIRRSSRLLNLPTPGNSFRLSHGNSSQGHADNP